MEKDKIGRTGVGGCAGKARYRETPAGCKGHALVNIPTRIPNNACRCDPIAAAGPLNTGRFFLDCLQLQREEEEGGKLYRGYPGEKG